MSSGISDFCELKCDVAVKSLALGTVLISLSRSYVFFLGIIGSLMLIESLRTAQGPDRTGRAHRPPTLSKFKSESSI